MKKALRPGILIDRDGTLIEERNYLSDPAGVQLFPGVAAAGAAVNRAGHQGVVVERCAG